MKILKSYSYDMLKMFLNQFGTAIFGIALALAAVAAGNPILRNITSICAIIFYMFLLYTMTWDIGFRERVSVLQQKKKFNPFKGTIISLGANSINFLLAIFIMLGYFLGQSVSFFGSLGVGSTFGAMFLDGMYAGILAHPVNESAISSRWWVWLLLPIPSILTCTIAYIMGLKDVKLFKKKTK